MLSNHLRAIAQAQVARAKALRETDEPELSHLVQRAMSPAEIRRALMKERPVLAARHSQHLSSGPDPRALREEAAAVGLLDATPRDLAWRDLFPTLDAGVYCAHHAMGVPSVALLPAMEEHLGHLLIHGIHAWDLGGWADVREQFVARVSELCGAADAGGDVALFQNFSDGLSAALNAGISGHLLTGEDHFTSARYVHVHWAERTGCALEELAGDRDEWVPTEAYIEALTPDTAAVSLSHAHWRTGRLHDLEALAEAMAAVCPDAVLLLDAYQTLGTVPVSPVNLPLRTAILGGGIKQLHAGTGSGFGWFSDALLADLAPARTGWFAHVEPLAFAPPPLEPGPGAARFNTGAPDVTPMAALANELEVFATSAGGSLAAAVLRARAWTRRSTAAAIEAAKAAGFDVVTPEEPKRRAAFVALRFRNGQALVDALYREGIVCDFRPEHPDADSGLLRILAASASFPYELVYTVERIAAYVEG